MEEKHITAAKQLYQDVEQALYTHRVADALYALGGVQCVHSDWAISQRYEQLQEAYQQMMAYMAKGVIDKHREVLYTQIKRDIAELNTRILAFNLSDSTEEFYAIRRANKQRHIDIVHTTNRLINTCKQLTLQHDSPNNNAIRQQYTERLAEGYHCASDLFKCVLTSVILNIEEVEVLEGLLVQEEVHEAFKSILISSLTLGCYQHFDINKFKLLNSALTIPSAWAEGRAVVGLTMLLAKHEQQLALYYPDIHALLQATFTTQHYAALTAQIQQHLNIAQLTEEISRSVHEELAHKITQLRATLAQKNTPPDTPQEGHVEEEMEELVGRLRLLYEQKADIHYGAFAMMKQRSSFFKDIVSWFAPFDVNHPELRQALPTAKFAGIQFVQNMPLCNSDRYSMASLFTLLPPQGYEEMVEQLRLSNSSISHTQPTADYAVAVSQEIHYYLQDLYRFFALYNTSSPYGQCFKDYPVLTVSPLLQRALEQAGKLNTLADEAFALGLYAQASQLYQAYELSQGLNSEELYHLGICLQREKKLHQAMSCYEKADLLAPNTPKILYALARGSKKLGNIAQALHYYKGCEHIEPENTQLLMQIGHLLLSIEHYEEALNYFYKVDYLTENNPNSTRAIAWCNFILNNASTAERYYKKLIAGEPTTEDYINAGHYFWCSGQIDQAIKCYTHVDKSSIALIRNDEALLLQRGITKTDIALLCDWLAYHTKNTDNYDNRS